MSIKQTSTTYPIPPDDYQKFINDDKIPLKPPNVPTETFKIFGKEQPDLESSKNFLEDLNIPILYDINKPPLMELKVLNHKILFKYQELIGIIAEGNQDPTEILDNIQKLFFNAHHILHTLRTAQAYEHMHFCLNDQMESLKQFKKKFDEHLNEMNSLKPP